MSSSPGEGTANGPIVQPTTGRVRGLVSLALIVVYATGVALVLSTMQVAWGQIDLVCLLIEILFSIPNALAISFYWLSLVIAGATAALLVGLGLRSLLYLLRGEEDVRGGLRLRVFAYLAMGCIVLTVFVFSSPAAINGPFRLQFPVMFQLLTTFVLTGYGLWTIRVIRRKPRLPGRFCSAVGVLCMNVVVALVMAELLLRLVATFVPIPILVTDESSSKIRRNAERLLPGTLRFGFPVNLDGHYDTEFLPASERTRLTVASIGDSFAYGTVPHAYHFTTIIEREKPEIEVYNLGFPGIGPIDYLYLLEGTALPLDPDLVLIQIFPSNDFQDGAPSSDPPGWYDADYYLVGILWNRWQILRRAEQSDSTAAVDGVSQEIPSLEERYPFLLDPMLETPAMSEELFRAIEIARARQIGSRNLMFQTLFYRALENIIAAAAAHDVPLAFVMIPDEFQVEDALWEQLLGMSEVPLDRNLVLRDTLAWLKARHIPVLDLLPTLRAVEPLEDGDRHLYLLRDTHFNARGNAVAGIAMAAFIQQVLSAAPAQNTERYLGNEAPLQETSPRGELSSYEATEVLLEFGALIKELGVNGSEVFDESLLNPSKGEIKSAIVIILNGEIVEDQKAFAREAAPVLAFFQPGVGKTGIALDTLRSDQKTWRSVVEADMQEINRVVVSGAQAQ